MLQDPSEFFFFWLTAATCLRLSPNQNQDEIYAGSVFRPLTKEEQELNPWQSSRFVSVLRVLHDMTLHAEHERARQLLDHVHVVSGLAKDFGMSGTASPE